MFRWPMSRDLSLSNFIHFVIFDISRLGLLAPLSLNFVWFMGCVVFFALGVIFQIAFSGA